MARKCSAKNRIELALNSIVQTVEQFRLYIASDDSYCKFDSSLQILDILASILRLPEGFNKERGGGNFAAKVRYQILDIINIWFAKKYRFSREESLILMPFDTAFVTTRCSQIFCFCFLNAKCLVNENLVFLFSTKDAV